jgi:hypothetical protein
MDFAICRLHDPSRFHPSHKKFTDINQVIYMNTSKNSNVLQKNQSFFPSRANYGKTVDLTLNITIIIKLNSLQLLYLTLFNDLLQFLPKCSQSQNSSNKPEIVSKPQFILT